MPLSSPRSAPQQRTRKAVYFDVPALNAHGIDDGDEVVQPLRECVGDGMGVSVRYDNEHVLMSLQRREFRVGAGVADTALAAGDGDKLAPLQYRTGRPQKAEPAIPGTEGGIDAVPASRRIYTARR